MTILSSAATNQLPPLKLPFHLSPPPQTGERRNSDEWFNTSHALYKEDYHCNYQKQQQQDMFVSSSSGEYDYCNNNNHKLSVDILLPPILTTTNQQQQLPLSPPYSACSSALSVSSFPSSPNSSPTSSFTSNSKKGSIQSLLNSGSELLALEQQKKQQQKDYYLFPPTASVIREEVEGRETSEASVFFTEEEFKKKNNKRSLTMSVTPQQQPKKQKTIQIEDSAAAGRQIKGLRLFSKQVCDKVAEKKTTTYNQVADELAADIQRSSSTNIDQKNIRRRVYDALNVLMALDIITKDRKEIKWVGLHSGDNQHEQQLLENEIQLEESRQKELLDSIQLKKRSCHDTRDQLNRLSYLVNRNQHQAAASSLIQFPFYLIQGQGQAEVDYNEPSLSFNGGITAIYYDIDILAKIWPQLPSSTVTTVS